MIIYGTKTTPLNTLNIPIPCKNCNHPEQELIVLCTHFTLFFIPFLPYWKKSIFMCPNCQAETKAKKYLADYPDSKAAFKALVKKSKPPVYLFITTLVAFVLMCGVGIGIYYDSEKTAATLASYKQTPTENAIVMLKVENAAYPYALIYVPSISDGDVTVLWWNYSYEKFADAKKEIKQVVTSLEKKTVETNFYEPVLISYDDFSKLDIVHVNSLTTTYDWQKS